ncbi:VOC family protein [Chitinophaga silvatica]|uniref:VOC family protein n=2 Tax=Chitinophaga silvatica TaxID=2282649 RepID=A0A3E1Y3V1_9BACT|nr:VOC family protein [Chitinophaga silvatica]
MTINHLNLVVNNVSEAITFFETYFNFNCELVKGDNVIAILTNSNNFTLVIMGSKNGDTSYPRDFHIGFMLDSTTEVDALHAKLQNGNISVPDVPKKIRNSYAFYFHFDNIFMEVGHYLNQTIESKA